MLLIIPTEIILNILTLPINDDNQQKKKEKNKLIELNHMN